MKKNSIKKKSNPLVSIIMNCHNGEKYLETSLPSIFEQNYKNWEVIFWDNSSTDNSKAILKKFSDKRIKYFYSKKFNSLYKSRNLAITKAKGKYLCFLDVDDQWKYDKLFKQVSSMEKTNSMFMSCVTASHFISNITFGWSCFSGYGKRELILHRSHRVPHR